MAKRTLITVQAELSKNSLSRKSSRLPYRYPTDDDRLPAGGWVSKYSANPVSIIWKVLYGLCCTRCAGTSRRTQAYGIPLRGGRRDGGSSVRVHSYKYLSVLVIPWESASGLCKDFFWEGRNQVAFPFLSFFLFFFIKKITLAGTVDWTLLDSTSTVQ